MLLQIGAGRNQCTVPFDRAVEIDVDLHDRWRNSLRRRVTDRQVHLLAEIEADSLRMEPQREAKLHRMTHQNARSLTHLESKLRKIEARLAANVPGICFGTRKLFGQQHHLELASFDSREAWLREWQARRSHQVFFVGSKDETAGNQRCQLQRTVNGTYALKIRAPDRLLSPGDNRYLVVCDVTFDYDRAALDTALEANVALSWDCTAMNAAGGPLNRSITSRRKKAVWMSRTAPLGPTSTLTISPSPRPIRSATR